MERIDGNTWRTDNGDEVRAQGLMVTVEFGEKTKAEVLCAVEAVKAENDRLRELLHEAVQAAHRLDKSDWPIGNRLCFIEEARELGIEADG